MKTLALSLFLLTTSVFSATIEIPSEDLLLAAKSIRAQSNTFYSASGTLSCTSLNTGWGPATASCSIEMNDQIVDVSNPAKIIAAVSAVLPPRGPFYRFSGQFEATSLSTDFPPYETTSKAVITLE